VQRAFDEVGETSFSAFLREVRLRNAALLLAPQPLTVRQVSLLVGYRQPAHFAKAFRWRYGVTPARYQPARTNIVGWLRIVARREAIRLARHDRRNAALSAQVMDPRTGAAVTSGVEAASALRALAALPARKRAVLTMRVAGYSHREIGDHLQMTPRTVERQMLRARAAVRERVAAGA
jgi:RNA polymerase sigma factor (sigma-70 family)